MEDHIQKVVNENPDSIAFGSVAKGTLIKVYGNFDNPKEFKEKLDKAKEVRDYAEKQFKINY